MRHIASLLLAAALLLARPSAAQVPWDPCNVKDPPLVGTVTDAETGRPVPGATVYIAELTGGHSGESGCYALYPLREKASGPVTVRAQKHRYIAVDTVLELTPGRTDTAHFALRPAPPPCCRLQGEWSLRLILDSIPGGNELEPKANEVEGPIVFSDRLPPSREDHHDPLIEEGRFGVDLSPFFGGPYAPDVSTTVFGPATRDFFKQAVGEVFAGDSVVVAMIPGMSHGGLSLEGTLRGDTVRGTWVQEAFCCGAQGHFVMHRVPPSAAGDSLVAQGIRGMSELRGAAKREQAARSRRVGRLRLRVWDEGTGRYVSVDLAARGHEDNPDGGTTSLSYSSGEDGWGRADELEPGRYDLVVYQYTCNGETRMADWVDGGDEVPRVTVTIEPGAQVDQDIRLDVCAIKPFDDTTRDDREGEEEAKVVAPIVPRKP